MDKEDPVSEFDLIIVFDTEGNWMEFGGALHHRSVSFRMLDCCFALIVIPFVEICWRFQIGVCWRHN